MKTFRSGVIALALGLIPAIAASSPSTKQTECIASVCANRKADRGCDTIATMDTGRGRRTSLAGPGAILGPMLAPDAAIGAIGSLDPRMPAYGAKGDTQSFANGCTVRGAVATCNAAFTTADIGKVVLVHGAGAGGMAFQSTIVGVAGRTANLADAVATPVADAGWAYGTDDTAAIEAWAADVAARHKTGRVTAGAYWLASQTSPLPLDGLAYECDAPSIAGYTPYTRSGCVLVLDNRSSSVFSTGTGFSIRGFTFYWPKQDGTGAAPLAYRALFGGSTMINGAFEHNTVVNAFDTFAFRADGGAGVGRNVLRNNRIYSVRFDFDMQSGMQDTLDIDGSNYFGPGVYGDVALSINNAMLQKYSLASGEVFHIDIGGSDAQHHYHGVDGLKIEHFIVQQKHDLIHLVSGLLNVSTIDEIHLDSTQRMLAVDGSASVQSTAVIGGQVYSSDPYDAAGKPAAAVIELETTGPIQMSFTGVNVAYAKGDVYRDAGSGYRNISWSGGQIAAWGRSARRHVYYAFMTLQNRLSQMTISGVHLAASPAAGNSAIGIHTTNNASTLISGNHFIGTYIPIEVTGSVGMTTIGGNTSIGTTGPTAINNATNGAKIYEGGNAFDKTGWATTGFMPLN